MVNYTIDVAGCRQQGFLNTIYYEKAIILFLCSCNLFGVTLSSCTKEGPEGPEGEQGEAGAQGIPGTDGSMIHSGNGAPDGKLGAAGDFYIDLASSSLYGPKSQTSWGNGTSLKGNTGSKGDKGDRGATGSRGAAGSQFLSGTSNPTTVGAVGDFYFNVKTGVLFGPKTSSGWGVGTSLRGPKGEKGDKGDPGSANVRSSGWVKLGASKWYAGAGYSSPNDISSTIYSANSEFPLSRNELNGVVLVYVRNLNFTGRPAGAMLLPVMDKVDKNGQNFTVELRFSHLSDPNYASYVDLSAGLQRGTWSDSYMKNTYLSSLEWKVVSIPAILAKKHERELSKIDLKDHSEVVKYFNLNE